MKTLPATREYTDSGCLLLLAALALAARHYHAPIGSVIYAVRRAKAGDPHAFARFANTEKTRQTTSPGLGRSTASPEGPGRDGNKPLMRNRTAMRAIPKRQYPGEIFR